jgi:transcriptional regulator with XRE-family HTH domain
MTLGERLRELRLHNGLTLTQLGHLCHSSFTMLSEIERERRYPSMNLLFAIARAYRMSIADILRDVDETGYETEQGFAPGLLDLCNDPTIGGEITPTWLALLGKLSLNGKRPQTKRDWLEIYLHLKRILEKEIA